jgi:hypothetical protein
MEIKEMVRDEQSIRQLLETTREGLRQLMTKFNLDGAPYDVNADDAYNDAYIHLARTKENHDA